MARLLSWVEFELWSVRLWVLLYYLVSITTSLVLSSFSSLSTFKFQLSSLSSLSLSSLLSLQFYIYFYFIFLSSQSRVEHSNYTPTIPRCALLFLETLLWLLAAAETWVSLSWAADALIWRLFRLCCESPTWISGFWVWRVCRVLKTELHLSSQSILRPCRRLLDLVLGLSRKKDLNLMKVTSLFLKCPRLLIFQPPKHWHCTNPPLCWDLILLCLLIIIILATNTMNKCSAFLHTNRKFLSSLQVLL